MATINFAPNVDPSQLTQHSRDEIEHALDASGNPSCTITALIRTPHDEARIVHDNLIRPVTAGTMTMEQSAAAQKAIYRAPGQAVIDVWLASASLSAADTISAMEAEVIRQGPKNVTHHCCIPSIDLLQTVDIAQSSLVNVAALKAIINGHPSDFSKCLDENSCLHAEIPQPPQS